MEKIQGTVESIIFSSPDGGYTVFRMRPERKSRAVNVTMRAFAPLVGQEVLLEGDWVTHPRYGEQFKAEHMRIFAPADAVGIERFLASGAIAGLGPAMARRVVEKFGNQALEIIEHHPGRLSEVEGIGKKTAKKIHHSYMEQEELRDVMIWLETHGISGAYSARIFAKYGSRSLDMLEHHPYRLARDIDGIGFATADAIATGNGVKRDDMERMAAGIDYALLQAAQYGHCCMPATALMERAAKLLGIDGENVREALKRQIVLRRLDAEDMVQETLIYPIYLYQAEQKTAQYLQYLKEKARPLSVEEPLQLVNAWEEYSGIALAEKQREAVAAVLEYGIFVLTGGPGTGKTMVVRAMLDILRQQGLDILLGAPTGRAAKRLEEAAGFKATTVHRMLGAQNDGEGAAVFDQDAEKQLRADAIILDEVSMMDIVLMQHFLEAVPDGCHVILVGDVDQLPAVGPGSVLKDILRSGVVPSVRLSEVFRQSGESSIVLNAHAINAGRMPVCDPGTDFQFIEIDDDEKTAERVVSLCAESLPKLGFDALRDVQVLSPMHRQSCGVENLNRLLQAELNPPAPYKPEFVNSTQVFRLGDKVMQTKNNYVKKVFNGDIGFIQVLEADKVTVRYGEEHEVDYERSELAQLQLAYAMSVHKSQGSEYPIVVLPLVTGHGIMLQRNLLYTAVTRAKQAVILLGSKDALRRAVQNDRTRRRYTLLAERLCHALE